MPDPPMITDLPSVGTTFRIEPCGDKLRPAVPDPPAGGPTLGLTFSGGGFRATLAALGTIRYLADAGLLANVRYASSVSGGSIANGMLARAWPELRRRGHTAAAVDELLVDPVVARISGGSMKWSLLRNVWRAAGSGNRTDVLGRQLDEWFFHGLRLQDLDPEVRWVFNSANLVTGVRFSFERDVVGDYVIGLVPTSRTSLRVAQAAAASAAVPGAFAAWRLEGVKFPCGTQPPLLLDGGVYDNTGLEVIDGDAYDEVFTVSMNAGGLLRPGGYGRIPVVRDLSRANSLLYRQSTSLRTRMMVSAFKRAAQVPAGQPLPEGARRGVLFALGTDMQALGGMPAFRAAFPEARTWKGDDLALVPTVFDKLEEALCRRLVYRGWWLTGAAFASYYPERVPEPGALRAPSLPAGAG